MSLSNHVSPKSLKNISSGVQHHQERFSEKEALEVLKNTSSSIDVTQTKYNKSLYKSDKLKDKSVKEFVSNELKIVNEKRVSEGKRKRRPDANSIGVGTFQISDDSLEKIGYDKSKKWEDQTEQARKNVTVVYERLVRNAVSKPDIYGRVLTATLHVDEGSPHVDYMTTGVDAERPDWSLREVLNGKEWRDETGKRRFPPKGAKLRALQDDLNTVFSEQEQKNFGLHRGSSESENMDYAKKKRKVKKQLDDREESLSKRESLLEARTRELDKREADLDRQTSERLREAQRALRGAEEEKGRLDEQIARQRAEIARLDKLEMSDRDKAVLAYMKDTRSKQAPDKSIFQTFDDYLMKVKADELLKRVGNGRQNDGFSGPSY